MVVLPVPVGPVTRMMPCGRRDEVVEDAAARPGRSRAPARSCTSTSGSKMRITTFSPKATGRVETRSSTSRPPRIGLDAAVLRPALLGDVEARQRLDARDDGGVHDLGHASGCRAARRRCGSAPALSSRLGSMWMSLGALSKACWSRNSTALTTCWSRGLDLGLALHAHELLEVAEVDARRSGRARRA